MQRKEFLHRAALITGAALALPATNALARGPGGRTATAQTLTAQETVDLRFMREEEKLAHDVYTALYAQWGAAVFANIAVSETDHTEAILDLLQKYGLADPAAGKPAGVFEDVNLQAWYYALVAQGQVSLIEGLKVGALVEETDIRDIAEKASHTTRSDILKVLDSLQCGSRNHLRAFNRQLVARGVIYQPQVLTQAEWDAVANSANERCGR